MDLWFVSPDVLPRIITAIVPISSVDDGPTGETATSTTRWDNIRVVQGRVVPGLISIHVDAPGWKKVACEATIDIPRIAFDVGLSAEELRPNWETSGGPP